MHKNRSFLIFFLWMSGTFDSSGLWKVFCGKGIQILQAANGKCFSLQQGDRRNVQPISHQHRITCHNHVYYWTLSVRSMVSQRVSTCLGMKLLVWAKMWRGRSTWKRAWNVILRLFLEYLVNCPFQETRRIYVLPSGSHLPSLKTNILNVKKITISLCSLKSFDLTSWKAFADRVHPFLSGVDWKNR